MMHYPDFIHQHSLVDTTLISHTSGKSKMFLSKQINDSELDYSLLICSSQNIQIISLDYRKWSICEKRMFLSSILIQNMLVYNFWRLFLAFFKISLYYFEWNSYVNSKRTIKCSVFKTMDMVVLTTQTMAAVDKDVEWVKVQTHNSFIHSHIEWMVDWFCVIIIDSTRANVRIYYIGQSHAQSVSFYSLSVSLFLF